MRYTQLGETGLQSSVLGFGCAALMGRAGRRESLRALAAAWEAGITFYDTARSYGYGQSESLLGQFLRERRSQAVIATKFGILPSPQPSWKRLAKPLVRSLLRVAPGLRGAVRQRTTNEFTPNLFSVDMLLKSLEQSLRSLGTDYVDLLFMHSAPASVLRQDDLLLALEKLVSTGKVRVAGISADPGVIGAALQQKPSPLKSVQFPCNIFDFSAAQIVAELKPRGWVAVANHPFGGVMRVQQSRAALRRIAISRETSSELLAKLENPGDAVLADVVLNAILHSSGIHVVIPSMMKTSHLRDNVNAISRSRFTPAEVVWLQARICSTWDDNAPERSST